eukprot:9357439-Pyramimonas_sp.AAC.1
MAPVAIKAALPDWITASGFPPCQLQQRGGAPPQTKNEGCIDKPKEERQLLRAPWHPRELSRLRL